MIDIHHDTFVQTIGYTTPSMNPKGNYGLCVIVMCQCKFILGLKKKKVPLCWVMMIMRKLCMCRGRGHMRNLFLLENKVFNKRRTQVMLDEGPTELPLLNLFTFIKTQSTDKVTFWVTGVWDSNIFLGGHCSTYNSTQSHILINWEDAVLPSSFSPLHFLLK